MQNIVDKAMDTPLVLKPSDRPHLTQRGQKLRQLRKEAEELEKIAEKESAEYQG